MNNKKNIFSALLVVIFVGTISAATKKTLSEEQEKEVFALQKEAYGLLKKGERPPTNDKLKNIQKKFTNYPGGQNHFFIILEGLRIDNFNWFGQEEINALMQKIKNAEIIIEKAEAKKDEN